MPSHRRLIIVLGVRRSGTSAITKGLETVGVSLVDASLTPFDELNEKGYWEDLEFHAFNIKLIHALVDLEQRRRGMLLLTEREVDFLCDRGFLQQGSDLVLSKLSALQQPLGLKDPQFSMFLPFWKRVFKTNGVAASYVIALRDPLSTVASMKKFGVRHKAADAPLEKLFWIWITSILCALDGSEGEERVVVDYSELLQNPELQMRRIANVFRLQVQEKQLQDYRDYFVDSKLCHFKAVEFFHEPTDALSRFAIEIYQQLFALARIFHTDSSRGAAQHDADKADEDFGAELYWTYRSSLNRSPTQSASGSRKPQQNWDEISGLAREEALWEQLRQVRKEWEERLALTHSLLALGEKSDQVMLMFKAAVLAQQETIDKMKFQYAPRKIS